MKKLQTLLLSSVVGFLSVGYTTDRFEQSAQADQAVNSAQKNIFDTALEADEFRVLTAALSITGLASTVRDEGPFTVFAPTDAAFYELGTDTLNDLFNNPEQLRAVLLYHVASGTLTTQELSQVDFVETLTGDRLRVDTPVGQIDVGRSGRALIRNIFATNGVIHAIDTVLNPNVDGPDEHELPSIVEIAQSAGQFHTLVRALQVTGLDTALSGEGTFTVFAPTDAAFARLGQHVINDLFNNPHALADVLRNHVLNEHTTRTLHDLRRGGFALTLGGEYLNIFVNHGEIRVGNALISSGDIEASNGIIHVLDDVITNPRGH